ETAGTHDLSQVCLDVCTPNLDCCADSGFGCVSFFWLTSMTTEQRLQELREQAWDKGIVAGRGVDVTGGPIPHRSGYYGQPIVKPPVWTWEIPIYFFIGGLAGMAAGIAFAGL